MKLISLVTVSSHGVLDFLTPEPQTDSLKFPLGRRETGCFTSLRDAGGEEGRGVQKSRDRAQAEATHHPPAGSVPFLSIL